MPKLWTDEETRPFQAPWYDAWVYNIVDADTFDVIWDVGGDLLRKVRLRLLSERVVTTPDDTSDDGVDAWEVRGEERELGKAATDAVRKFLKEPEKGQLAGSHIRLYTRKGGSRGSLGRWLTAVFCPVREAISGELRWQSLGDWLIEEGHAEVWKKK